MRMEPNSQDLTGFKALSFDCYGTLIDWESGIIGDLEPILSRLPETHSWRQEPRLAVLRFNHSSAILWESQPTLSYPNNLSEW
jgi:FMN phosphatase YigB (HAD superfamily)